MEESKMIDISLENMDIAIMIIYAVLIVGYGIYHAKRKNSEEYFLAGRNMLWPVVGISLFAANISSSTLVGLSSDAFKTNTHVFNYEWLAAVVLVFFAIFFLPFYLKSRVYTMPEFLERRYDSRSRYYFSFITIVGNVLIDTAAAMYAGMIILKLIFPSIPSFYITIALALAAAAYTIPGGLNSVIQTEIIQAIILIIGSIMLTYFALNHEDVGGWSGLMGQLDEMGASGQLFSENAYGEFVKLIETGEIVNRASVIIPEGKTLADVATGTYMPINDSGEVMSLVRPSGDAFMPWTGLLFGAPILGFYFWANNQFMVQRVLGAKDLNHGRWGALFAGLLKLPVLFIMVIPGTIAILLYADVDLTSLNYLIDNPDTTVGGKVPCENLKDCPNATYPVMLFDNLLPVGIKGLVVAGLLAAMMSSISATFNSASTLFTMDFVQKLNPKMSSERLVRVGQITTLVLVVLATAWAPFIETFDSLWEYLQKVLSYIAPPVAATFLVGLFWKRANGNGSIAGLLTGFGITIVMVIASLYSEDDMPAWAEFLNGIHFLHFTAYLFVLCSFVVILVSAMTNEPQAVFQRAATSDDVEKLGGEVKVGDMISDRLENYVWKKSIFTEETEELKGMVWYKNYRIQSVILLILTALLVGYYW